MKNEKWIFNFQFSNKNWKLKIEKFLSFFNFQFWIEIEITKNVLAHSNFKMKIEWHFRCTDCKSVGQKASVYENVHFIFVQFSIISRKWKLIFWQFSIQFSIFNNFKQMKIGFGQFSIRFLIFRITEKIENGFFGNFQFFT